MKVDAPGATIEDADGWRVLTKKWRPGDDVTISFSPGIERKTMADGGIYWTRGPLVFALPIAPDRQAIRGYPVEGFADYECAPKPGAFWDYAVDEASGGFRLEKAATTNHPWSDSPLRLSGQLLNRYSGTNELVQLVPMGTTILRRTVFADMKRVRALRGDANLARKAKIEVPSCAPGYRAEAMVDGVTEGFPDNPAAEWASQGGRVGTKVRFSWPQPVTVGCLWLFDRPNPADHVRAARVDFSDSSSTPVGELPNDGQAPFKLNFPPKTITWLEIVVTEVGPHTKNVGFSEIAVFEKEPAE
jgi:hypothetical protein